MTTITTHDKATVSQHYTDQARIAELEAEVARLELDQVRFDWLTDSEDENRLVRKFRNGY